MTVWSDAYLRQILTDDITFSSASQKLARYLLEQREICRVMEKKLGDANLQVRELKDALSYFTDKDRGHRESAGEGRCLEHPIISVPHALPCPVSVAQRLVTEKTKCEHKDWQDVSEIVHNAEQCTGCWILRKKPSGEVCGQPILGGYPCPAVMPCSHHPQIEKRVEEPPKCACPCHPEIKRLGYGFPCGVDECAPCGEAAARHGLTGE